MKKELFELIPKLIKAQATITRIDASPEPLVHAAARAIAHSEMVHLLDRYRCLVAMLSD